MNSKTHNEYYLWLTEQDVLDLVDLNLSIDALREALVLEAQGQAMNVDKALGIWERSSMHCLGSMMPERGYMGFKTWVNTPAGGAATYSLFDSRTAQLLAVMEAASLGQSRTAAISGLATDALSDRAADDMALIGTGAQAITQAAAVAVVRPLRRLRVYSPTPEKRAAFVARAAREFECEVIDAASVEEAVRDAPIITLITRASQPFLQSAMVARGAHLNAAGAILPGNAEFAADLFGRADLVVVDSLGNAMKGSQELMDNYGRPPGDWSQVHTLGQVLAGGLARPQEWDVTIFKPMGMGLSDLAVAVLAYERARAEGRGVAMPQPRRGSPKWRAASVS